MALTPSSDSIPYMSQNTADAHMIQDAQEPTANADASKASKLRKDRRERPCDACRRRKSKCVITPGNIDCAACGMHGQTCTYVEDPRPRKRRVDGEQHISEVARKKSAAPVPTIKQSKDRPKIKKEESEAYMTPLVALGGWQHRGSHVGYTTELEPMLFDLARQPGPPTWNEYYQKSDQHNAFLTFGSEESSTSEDRTFLAITQLVDARGPALLQHFRTKISRSFPILDEGTLIPPKHESIDPVLLCTIYTVAASSIGFAQDSRGSHVVRQLEDLSLTLIRSALSNPKISTIQAALLIMQRSDIHSKFLNTQVVGAVFELGLHLDSTTWSVADNERGVRKRLAWAAYMQDQWSSLIHGRPSLISKSHWAVPDLTETDFGLDHSDDSDSQSSENMRGRESFCQLIALTRILSNILEAFYTQMAIHEYDAAGEQGTRLILERAKPIQMKLKDWFTRLPKMLKLENGQAPTPVGHLHLAYFATEITLHRCIIRSLSNPTSPSTDHYLIEICRGAAKSRLISAMDFVNRLRSEHLTSFWYFPSKVNFALVATFGSLLLATAPCEEEANFYRSRLSEYHWTLRASAKEASWLTFAVESLKSSEDLLQALPSKPRISELDSSHLPTPQIPIPHLIPQPSQEQINTVSASSRNSSSLYDANNAHPDLGRDLDNDMLDAPDLLLNHPIHSSDFQSQNFAAGLSGWNPAMQTTSLMNPINEEMTDMPSNSMFYFQGDQGFPGQPQQQYEFTGPFAGTPFEGLGARNWFDNSHHGSPEAERMGLLM